MTLNEYRRRYQYIHVFKISLVGLCILLTVIFIQSFLPQAGRGLPFLIFGFIFIVHGRFAIKQKILGIEHPWARIWTGKKAYYWGWVTTISGIILVSVYVFKIVSNY